jgi:hypothetical protein
VVAGTLSEGVVVLCGIAGLGRGVSKGAEARFEFGIVQWRRRGGDSVFCGIALPTVRREEMEARVTETESGTGD